MRALLLVPLLLLGGCSRGKPDAITPMQAPELAALLTPPTQKWPDHCSGHWDLDNDGLVDATTTAQYAPDADRIVEVWADWTADGQRDDRFFFRYDAAGQRTVEIWDTHDDGHLDETLTVVWRHGRPHHGEVDADSDGTVDGRATYAFDAAGNLVKEEWDKDGDGRVDEHVTHRYDAFGNRLGSFYDDLYDTQPDENMAFSYACWTAGGPQRLPPEAPPSPTSRPPAPVPSPPVQ